MQQKKTTYKVIGIILYLAGIIWAGIVGFYPRDLPWIFGILAIATACIYISSKIKIDGDDGSDV